MLWIRPSPSRREHITIRTSISSICSKDLFTFKQHLISIGLSFSWHLGSTPACMSCVSHLVRSLLASGTKSCPGSLWARCQAFHAFSWTTAHHGLCGWGRIGLGSLTDHSSIFVCCLSSILVSTAGGTPRSTSGPARLCATVLIDHLFSFGMFFSPSCRKQTSCRTHPCHLWMYYSTPKKVIGQCFMEFHLWSDFHHRKVLIKKGLVAHSS